jgi:hypothetical protein
VSETERALTAEEPQPTKRRRREYNRGWADGNAAALDACQPVIDRLQQALRVAAHSPHDQAGEPVEGFPVCSVCGAIQTDAERAARAPEGGADDGGPVPLVSLFRELEACKPLYEANGPGVDGGKTFSGWSVPDWLMQRVRAALSGSTAPDDAPPEFVQRRLAAGIAYALARAALPGGTETSRDYADRLAPLVIESGWLAAASPDPAQGGET